MTPPFKLVEGQMRPDCVECGGPIRDGDAYVYFAPERPTRSYPGSPPYIAHDRCPCRFCGDPLCDREEADCQLAEMGI